MNDEYTVVEQLNQGKLVTVNRCIRKADGARVVVKQVNAGVAYNDKARIRYEYKLLKLLAEAKATNVLVPVDLCDTGGHLTLVSEDIGGSSLMRLMSEKPFSLQETLHVAEQTAIALMSVHNARVIHKDINPNNIIYNRVSGQVQIIDFGISTQIPLELQAAESLRMLQGTLQYISPEQTGRMNRLLDYRSDFYSLGATLYHLLTKHAPFRLDEVNKLVHAVLAKVPDPVSAYAPQTPPVVVRIVERLMEKVPERRYQSAFGIRHDVATCLRTLGKDASVPPFEIGLHDHSDTFVMPQKLYGRERDIQHLHASYQRIVQQRREFLWVSGPSGIGKSALVNEVQALIVEHNGIFMSGKFDQLRRHVPFNAFSQAFSGLIRRILASPEDALADWRQRVQGALGNIGQALVDIVPTLGLLVGPQKPIPELGPQETENRLLLLLSRLVHALCATRPLVIFLDDLQWADLGTLEFLKQLAADDRPCAGLLVIGAYRDGEVDAAHPLSQLIAGLRPGTRMPASEMVVTPMDLASVLDLVVDTTSTTRAQATALAELVAAKTGGNPFFVREFLKHLSREGLLSYNAQDAAWTWDLDRIQSFAVTDNVVELLTAKLRSLPLQEHRLLSMGACFGNEFKLSVLGSVNQSNRGETLGLLAKALHAGLILASEGNHRYAADTEEEVGYKFAHDRIQQAAYELLSPEEAQQLHYRIGRRLLEASDSNTPEKWAFTVVNQFNRCHTLVREEAERLQVARLNLIAAKEAKQSAAYGIAMDYLRAAAKVLPDDAWSKHYDLMLQHSLEVIVNEFLLGRVDAANTQIEEALARTRTAEDKAEVQRHRVLCMMALTQYPAGLEAGIEALRLLGFHLPLKPTQREVQWAQMRMTLALRGRSIADVATMPMMTDERILRIMRVLSSMVLPAVFHNPALLHVLVLAMGRLTIVYGNSPFSAYVYSSLAVIYSMLNQYGLSRKWAIATRRAIETMPTSIQVASSVYHLSAFIEFAWTLPRDQVNLLASLWDLNLESGDHLLAGISAFSELRGLAMLSVDECLEKFPKYHSFVETRASPQLRSWMRSLKQGALCLSGATAGLHTFDDQTFSEAKEEEFIHSGRGGAAAQVYYYYKTITLWLHRDLAAACEAAEQAAKSQILVKSTAQTALNLCFFACLALLDDAAANGRKTVRNPALFRAALRKLNRICAVGEDVYGGLPMLVRAELAALRGQVKKAARLYMAAAEKISQSGFPSFIAVTCECAGRFHHKRGDAFLALAYLSRARDAYRTWGAKPKVQALAHEFPETSGSSTIYDVTTSTTRVITNGHMDTATFIDLPAIMRAIQALSGEVVPDKLVEKLMGSISESAGATRAVLLLLEQEKLLVRADTAPEDTGFPIDVVQLVARSREAIVLDNAAAASEFKSDTYISRAAPKSLLCTPLMHQGELKGVVYLENRLASGAFTEDRLLTVALLAAQAATSLENAQTYSMLEERVAYRTQQLKEAQAKLLKMERESAEMRMAGGFGHEMRNALASAQFMLRVAFSDKKGSDPTLCEMHDEDIQMLNVLAQADTDVGKLKTEIGCMAASLAERQKMLQEVLGGVEHSVQRGLSITGQILEYARVGHMRVTGDDRVRIGDVVDTVVREFRDELNSKGIRIAVDVEANQDFPIKEAHLYAILRNLVDNACDALGARPEDGRAIMVRSGHEYGGVVLTVEDTGPGISEANKARIFEPFFSTKGASGTGLGLGLSRKLAQIYGGDLNFTSEMQRGTTFRLYLPYGTRPPHGS